MKNESSAAAAEHTHTEAAPTFTVASLAVSRCQAIVRTTEEGPWTASRIRLRRKTRAS